MSDPNTLPEGAPDDPLTGHDYDGIQEYDNPLPGWWKWLFVLSIIFTPPYFFFYHNGAEGRSLAARYDRNLAANMQLQFGKLGTVNADRDNVIRFLHDDAWLPVGKVVFKTNCVSCHRQDGGGQIGPNLGDEFYKNVKDIGDVLKVVENGANAGAMPAWKNRLSVYELVLVSSYVASLRGTITDGKDPEGREIPPWPGPPAASEEAADETTESDAASESDEADEPADDA